MKKGIHPDNATINVRCSCGNRFAIITTLAEELHVEICSKCHPFYTGQQKVRTGDRITRFRKRFGEAQPSGDAQPSGATSA